MNTLTVKFEAHESAQWRESAMEADTILKNGRNLKSQTSKGNILNIR